MNARLLHVSATLAYMVEVWRAHQDRDPMARHMLLSSGFATEDDVERPPPGWRWGAGMVCHGGNLRQPEPLPLPLWERAA